VRRFLTIYLVLYYLLIALAVATLWRSGLIDQLPRGWTVSSIACAVLLGILLALLSRR
jgi:hypothetical protein